MSISQALCGVLACVEKNEFHINEKKFAHDALEMDAQTAFEPL